MTAALAAAQTGSAAKATASSNVYPIQEGFVDAHGVLIYYKSIGRGAPLMVVHGGPGASHDYFLPYLLSLARTNRVVFIDERGSGRSEKLADVKQYTVEAMVEDAEAVRQALGLGKMSLLGHSYGGTRPLSGGIRHAGLGRRILSFSVWSAARPQLRSAGAEHVNRVGSVSRNVGIARRVCD